MKKYIPVDFDEKGNVILGRERNTPTSNGFIPTTWAPPAPVSEGSGLKSISISPVLETTPALDTVFPIYWEEGESHPPVVLLTHDTIPDAVTVTVTPTSDWYAFNVETQEPGNIGEPVTFNASIEDESVSFRVLCANGATPDDATQFIGFDIGITNPDI